MDVVDLWTGRSAGCLRVALRLTNEEFARSLGTALRTVAKWNAAPDLVPTTVLQRALDTLLDRAPSDARARFVQLLGHDAIPSQRSPSTATGSAASAAELRLAHDPAISEVLSWIDDHAHWPDGQARRHVADELGQLDARAMRDVAHARGQVTRSAIADTLVSYYPPIDGYRAYTATCAGATVVTSILTRAAWLDLELVLGQGHDAMSLTAPGEGRLVLDDEMALVAVRRVAEALATDTRLINMPLYDLRQIDVAAGRMLGQVGLTDFLSYALTLDLLHKELVDAIATGAAEQAMPLRRRYLPDTQAIVDLGARLCAGGPLALFAAARPLTRGGSRGGDYVVLIQERSGRTLNEAGRLAVIPKAFHQPLMDFSDDAHIGATLEREMEEELFGRDEVDATVYSRRRADPLHLSRLSPPMRWLIEHDRPETWRIECTGFGLNMVSGNFEFACLIVIQDETWWHEFGGAIEANWETEGLRRYSTRDQHGLAHLMHDASWSNEGLFSLLQGLRRLDQIGDPRMDIPAITVEV